jgi:hypothetical protein
MTIEKKDQDMQFSKAISAKPNVRRSTGKRERLSLLSAEIITDYKFNKMNLDITSSLSSVIWLLAKGTRNQEDCKDIIQTICPTFFER